MKISISLILAVVVVTTVSAFTTSTTSHERRVADAVVKLNMATTTTTTTRRDILNGITAGIPPSIIAVQPVLALNTIPADNEVIKEQRTVVEKLDINNAPVADYMQFPGMYPTIAGKISNNGPYASVKDVYKLKVLSKAEVTKVKEYANLLTATPSTGLDTMRGRDPYRRSFNK